MAELKKGASLPKTKNEQDYESRNRAWRTLRFSSLPAVGGCGFCSVPHHSPRINHHHGNSFGLATFSSALALVDFKNLPIRRNFLPTPPLYTHPPRPPV